MYLFEYKNLKIINKKVKSYQKPKSKLRMIFLDSNDTIEVRLMQLQFTQQRTAEMTYLEANTTQTRYRVTNLEVWK